MVSVNEQRDEALTRAVEQQLRGPILLDPLTALHSEYGPRFARTSREILVPATWAELLQKKDVRTIDMVLRDLTWTYPGRYERYQPTEFERYASTFRMFPEAKPFRLESRTRAALNEEYPEQWDWTSSTDQILAEVLSFLTSHSMVVLRNRRLLYALRDKGVAIWDATGRKLKRKNAVLEEKPQLKVILLLLITAPPLMGGSSPIVTSLLAGGAGAVLAVDPAV